MPRDRWGQSQQFEGLSSCNYSTQTEPKCAGPPTACFNSMYACGSVGFCAPACSAPKRPEEGVGSLEPQCGCWKSNLNSELPLSQPSASITQYYSMQEE